MSASQQPVASGGERLWAVIPAAGTGSRMGADAPKQYLRIADKTLLEYAAEAILAVTGLGGLVIALHPRDEDFAGLAIARNDKVHTVEGGAERAQSVLAGLEYLADHAAARDWVLVHDAARPCLQPQAVERLRQAVAGHPVGGILARPVTDTVKQADTQGEIARTVPRQGLWLAQTPQMFRYSALRDALLSARDGAANVTDEAMAMELQGHCPLLVEGDPGNLKVTYPQDLALAGWYLGGEGGLPCA